MRVVFQVKISALANFMTWQNIASLYFARSISEKYCSEIFLGLFVSLILKTKSRLVYQTVSLFFSLLSIVVFLSHEQIWYLAATKKGSRPKNRADPGSDPYESGVRIELKKRFGDGCPEGLKLRS